jgi:hypothetical protein
LIARIFDLVETDRDQVKLTDLGNRIVDPQTESQARMQAFLCVPLYRAIYDRYKGRLLPGDVAPENEMVTLGVAPKHKSRARQGFQRSAVVAGLTAQGKDRLVLPAGVSVGSTPQNGEKARKMDAQHSTTPPSFNFDRNAALGPLLKVMPDPGAEWPRASRQMWLKILEEMLDTMYKDEPEE